MSSLEGRLNADAALERCLKSTATEFGSSRWQEFRACPYGHHLRFVEGVSPRAEIDTERGKLDYFQVGQAFHAGQAFTAHGVIGGFAADWRAVLDAGAKRGVWGGPETEEARRLLWAYFARWGARNAGRPAEFKIIEVEPDGWFVRLPGAEPGKDLYTTRPDTVLRRRGPVTTRPLRNAGYAHLSRRYVLEDFKTRSKNYSENDDELARVFQTNPQFLGHAYVGREKLGSVPDILVNLAIKTRIPDFRRIYVRFTDAMLDDWAANHVASLAHRSFDERWKNYASCHPPMGNPCWAVSWCHGSAADRKVLYQITRKPSYEPKERKADEARRRSVGEARRAPRTERERETEERHKASLARANGRNERRPSR